MKNNIIKTGILSLLLVAQVSCSDDYFDVNTPSNTATLEELRMQDLMAPVIHSTMEGQRSAELAFGNYVQNFVSTGVELQDKLRQVAYGVRYTFIFYLILKRLRRRLQRPTLRILALYRIFLLP